MLKFQNDYTTLIATFKDFICLFIQLLMICTSNAVSSYRAKLGAAQNRLEHTINNLEVTSENITSAESRIRDTDMADEIMNFTKNNILLQASQSMLAQSNSIPQSILSLLS